MANHLYKIPVLILLILIIFLSSVSLFFFSKVSSFIITPADPAAGQKIFTIKPGQTLEGIARNLGNEGFISNPLFFKLYARYKKAGRKLQAGEYLLSASEAPEQILEILIKGKVKLHRITIPEGLNIKEIGEVVENAGFCSRTKFISLCYDGTFYNSLDIHAASLEGYLFPDTYFFPRHTSCKDIITAMVNQFNKNYKKEWQSRASELNFSVHDIVTLASIIEKETGDASERPLISSVFHNRLKKKMRLESDPTVIYGIKNFDGNIKRKHLKTKTPYNTYQIKGLPAGPIANPGALSLEAALYPAQTQYLFFVSKKDTTHQFSTNIRDHNRAVKKYQLNKK